MKACDSPKWFKEDDGSYSTLYLSCKLRAWKTERLGWHSTMTAGFPGKGKTIDCRTGASTLKEAKYWAEHYALEDFKERIKED